MSFAFVMFVVGVSFQAGKSAGVHAVGGGGGFLGARAIEGGGG